ncbi:MAG: hypothetical protein R3E12_12925 [Candidatus Eisenbacteria bacterium]
MGEDAPFPEPIIGPDRGERAPLGDRNVEIAVLEIPVLVIDVESLAHRFEGGGYGAREEVGMAAAVVLPEEEEAAVVEGHDDGVDPGLLSERVVVDEILLVGGEAVRGSQGEQDRPQQREAERPSGRPRRGQHGRSSFPGVATVGV